MNTSEPQLEEIHHYTTIGSLKGICETNQIWATRFDYLNDSSEFRYGFSLLDAGLRREIFKKLGDHPRTLQGINKLRSAIEKFTSPNDDQHAVEPFIASFCSHSDEHTRQHGLLSQWRAYADGGFCLVFDRIRLSNIIKEENSIYQYNIPLEFHEVSYEIQADPPSSVVSWFENFINNNEKAANDKFLRDILTFIGTHKHRGFKEESEVRIIGFPRLEKFSNSGHQLKTIAVENGKPLIKLFGQNDLPLKRIIISPGPNQNEARKEIKAYVGANIPIEYSEIPYIRQPSAKVFTP